MRAVSVKGPGDLSVAELPTPRPGTGEVAIEVAYVGICGSDLSYYRYGRVGEFILREPLIIGHEVVGRVAEDPRGDDGFAPGTPVTIHPATPGTRLPGLEDRPSIWPESRYLGSAATWPHTQGAASDITIARVDQVRVLPDDLPLRRAVLAEPLGVALHALNRAGGVEGRSVLVSGAGPIGLLVAGAAHEAGATHVGVLDVIPEPLEIALRVGADETYLVGRDEIPAERFDVVFECSGVPAAVDQALLATKRGGVVVQIGLLPGEARPYNLAVLTSRELDIRGSFRFDSEIDDAVAVLARTPELEAVVTAVYAAEEAAEAFELANDPRRSCKVALAFRTDGG